MNQPIPTLASLVSFTGEWTRRQATHLVRRTYFGNTVSDVNAIRTYNSAQTAVNAILNTAINSVLPADPSWFSRGNSSNIDHLYDIQFRLINQFYSEGLRGRMVLFWTNFFAVSYNNMNDLPGKAPNSYVSHIFNYVKLLQRDGLGDFKKLLRAVAKNSAMVYYLNNYNNTKTAPNEDFARELLELFTVGRANRYNEPNYSEQDIKEVARAVTGWRVNDSTLTSFFDSSRFDNTNKTIFGKTANYNLDTVIDLLFEEKSHEIAWFLSLKLYIYFISAEPDYDFIQLMADKLIEENFSISALLTHVFSSAYFYSDSLMGARIKSPTEIFIGFLRHFEIEPNAQLREYIRLRMQSLNEELLRPDTVFGWDGYNPPKSDGIPGHYAWLNTNLLPSRWNNLTEILFGRNDSGTEYNPIRLVEKMTNPDDPFAVAKALAEHIFAIPLELTDVQQVEEDFAGNPDFLPNLSGKSPQEINLTKLLLGPIPWYEWRSETTGGGSRFYPTEILVQLREYLSYLIQLPSYQHG